MSAEHEGAMSDRYEELAQSVRGEIAKWLGVDSWNFRAAFENMEREVLIPLLRRVAEEAQQNQAPYKALWHTAGERANQAEAELAAAREQVRRLGEKLETAWLIESRFTPGPSWWSGKGPAPWTRNANEAVRFVRRQDAEAAMDSLPDKHMIFVSEHMWIGEARAALAETAQPEGGEK